MTIEYDFSPTFTQAELHVLHKIVKNELQRCDEKGDEASESEDFSTLAHYEHASIYLHDVAQILKWSIMNKEEVQEVPLSLIQTSFLLESIHNELESNLNVERLRKRLTQEAVAQYGEGVLSPLYR
jgi:hypothetical protein